MYRFLIYLTLLTLKCYGTHLSTKVNVDESEIASMNKTALKKSMEELYVGCFQWKGCFGFPAGCEEEKNCDILLNFFNSKNGVAFEMHGLLEPNTYMAMGISRDRQMGDDAVTDCFPDGSKVIVRKSWNMGKVNSRTSRLRKGSYYGEYEDGLATCSWTEDYNMKVNGNSFDFINSTYYILLVKGPLIPFRRKSMHFERIASPKALNFSAYGVVPENRIGDINDLHEDLKTNNSEHTDGQSTLTTNKANLAIDVSSTPSKETVSFTNLKNVNGLNSKTTEMPRSESTLFEDVTVKEHVKETNSALNFTTPSFVRDVTVGNVSHNDVERKEILEQVNLGTTLVLENTTLPDDSEVNVVHRRHLDEKDSSNTTIIDMEKSRMFTISTKISEDVTFSVKSFATESSSNFILIAFAMLCFRYGF